MKIYRSPEWKNRVINRIRQKRAQSKTESVPSHKYEKVPQVLHVRASPENNTRSLTLSFIAMVFIGLGNKIFQKLQTIPMRNYPNFLNLLTTVVYIPLSFAYIIPMIKYGDAISDQQRRIPKRKFAVMGILDSIAGIMQVFAATYLGGSLLILLSQAAIPVSMIISKFLLKSKYTTYQYLGAMIVAAGLIVALLPSILAQNSDGDSKSESTWAVVMITSCIPMCLSSVYKEKALGETDLDAVYLNGWIAVFQFLCSIPLAIPAALFGNPSVTPEHLPEHLWDGLRCYLGESTLLTDDCDMSTVYVTVYLILNVLYNILIILILKFGNANILWLAMTIMVPIGNLAFTLPLMPDHRPLKITDMVGLVLILCGLFTYRFVGDLAEACKGRRKARLHLDDRQKRALKQSLLVDHADQEEVAA